MNCPVDGASLRVHREGALELSACDHCHGLWLSRDTLRRCLATKSAPQPRATAPVPTATGPAGAVRVCPVCAPARLSPRWLRTIEVDVCAQCHGLWLDAGELQRLIALPQQPAGAGTKPRESGQWLDHVDGQGAADLLELVVRAVPDLAELSTSAGEVLLQFLAEALGSIDF